ncbi:Major fimbrium subunit FimA type-1 [Bienertia sinuspersici]
MVARAVGIGCNEDSVGDVVAATCRLMDGDIEGDVAEALAARHVLDMACEAGLRNLVVKSDCNKFVAQLRRGHGKTTNFGAIVNLF